MLWPLVTITGKPRGPGIGADIMGFRAPRPPTFACLPLPELSGRRRCYVAVGSSASRPRRRQSAIAPIATEWLRQGQGRKGPGTRVGLPRRGTISTARTKGGPVHSIALGQRDACSSKLQSEEVGRVITHSDGRAAHAGKSRIHNWASYVFQRFNMT